MEPKFPMQRLAGDHVDGYRTLCPVPRVWGVSRSEIKEEAKPGDIRGGRYPVASAHALNNNANRSH